MSSKPQPLVSIVTPVYNEEAYLGECIESVLAQTYQNWDYTIIDNCSTDDSPEIARQYCARDSRIRVYRNETLLPAVSNHNVAMRHVSPQSRYCKVVLADDWIFPECLERMVALAEEHPSVGMVGAYALEGSRVAWAGLPYPSEVVGGRDICRRHLLDQLYVFGTPNSVLYRADLVRNRDPFFNEHNINADTEVCFDLLKTSNFGFVHQVLSFTRVRPKSLTSASRELGTDFTCLLQLLSCKAQDYLTNEEREKRLAQHLCAYYAFLGKSLLLRRGKAFWDYHKEEVRRAGINFSSARVVKGTVESLCRIILNPMQTLDRLLHGRINRRSPGKADVPQGNAHMIAEREC